MYEWQMSFEVGTNRNSRNKIRFNRLFKSFFATEEYCKLNMPFAQRAAYSHFRHGVAPLKIETWRYRDNPLKLEFAHSVQTILRMNSMLSSNAQRMIRLDNIY